MRVATSWTIPGTRETIWPLLCHSYMTRKRSCLFCLGIPRPKQCRLSSGSGGVGQGRECVSEEGTIRQRILEWEEERRLRFQMEETDFAFRRCISSLVDTFELERLGASKTRVTRTTDVGIRGPLRWVKAMPIWFGLKLVHRFVFRNWADTAATAVTLASAPPPSKRKAIF